MALSFAGSAQEKQKQLKWAIGQGECSYLERSCSSVSWRFSQSCGIEVKGDEKYVIVGEANILAVEE